MHRNYMKTFSKLLWAAMILVIASCKEKEPETIWDNPNFIRLTSSIQDVKNGGQKIQIKWNEKTSIKVF